ncbi:hypothetical protein RN001_013167 [Aquatica leii]|uniref:CIP2A N-terminal domain-containing protein n=1 Tax=Aquatica leii TaxID=1421715 RepID=A0AAN7NZM3_9COLE|nr:hypothetical protein RN001_013167 [Aquatica leii]
MSATLETSGITNDKYYNMKQFINTVRDYVQTKAEDSVNLLYRHLQLISNNTDLSIFDPHTNVVAEFFVCLHELLSTIEPGSLLEWCCINVLKTACKNSAARMALIHTYQFLPLLSKILDDRLNTEKKLRLLILMQDLTGGIKISWLTPNLPHLMSILTKWVECGEEEIVALSLAILGNLCYKNRPAIETLSRCIDIKKFLRVCMGLKGFKTDIHVCKLFIILDYFHGNAPKEVFLKLIELTFESSIVAFKTRDSMLLRHVIEVFTDVWDQNNHVQVFQNFKNYDNKIDLMVSELESILHGGGGDMRSDNNNECANLVIKFLNFVLKLRQPNLPALDSRLVNIALNWIQVDSVCSEALTLLREVAVNSAAESSSVLDPFLNCLPIFLRSIRNGDDEISTCIENNKKINSLIELLRVLVQAEYIRKRVLAMVKEELFTKIFTPLIGTSSSGTTNLNTCSTGATLLYVNCLALIYDLSKYDDCWIRFFTHLMLHKQIHMILAQALYNGSKETKALTLTISSGPYFPIAEVSTAMCELQALTQIDSPVQENNNRPKDDNLYPMMSVTQTEKLDEMLGQIKVAFEQNNLVGVSTSNIMELYEYRLATMGHAERAALASLEAVSSRCTYLQHRTAQLTTELSRLYQILLHTEQRYEDALKTKEAVLLNNKQLNEWMEVEKSKYSSDLSLKEKTINEKTQLLEEYAKQLTRLNEEKRTLEDNNNELKHVVAKLEDNLVKKEKLLERKEETLAKSNSNIHTLKMQVSELETQIKRTDSELVAKTRELTEVSNELHNCKSILGSITQLTNSQFIKRT